MSGGRLIEPLTIYEQEECWRKGICTTEPAVENWCGTGPIEPCFDQRQQRTNNKQWSGRRKYDEISDGVYGRKLDEREQVAVQVHHHDIDLMKMLREGTKSGQQGVRHQDKPAETDISHAKETRQSRRDSSDARKTDDCAEIEAILRCNEEDFARHGNYENMRRNEKETRRAKRDSRGGRKTDDCAEIEAILRCNEEDFTRGRHNEDRGRREMETRRARRDSSGGRHSDECAEIEAILRCNEEEFPRRRNDEDNGRSGMEKRRARRDSSAAPSNYECEEVEAILRCNEEATLRHRTEDIRRRSAPEDVHSPLSDCMEELDQEAADALYEPLRQPCPSHVPEVIFYPSHVIHSTFPCIDPTNSPLLSMWDKILLDATRMPYRSARTTDQIAEDLSEEDITAPTGKVKLDWRDVEDVDDCLPPFAPPEMLEELADILRAHYQHGMSSEARENSTEVWPLAFADQTTSAVEHGVVHLARRCGPLEKKSESEPEVEVDEPKVIKQTATVLTRHSRPRRPTVRTGMAPTDLSKSVTAEAVWTEMSQNKRTTKKDSRKKTAESEERPRSKSRSSSANKTQSARPDSRPRWNSSMKVEECHPKHV